MMRKKNSPYSEEFRKEALHLLATSGKSKTEIENDLGLTHGLLRKLGCIVTHFNHDT